MDQVLFDAARIMDERGKATGGLVDTQGRVCMMGAIRAACGVDSAGEPWPQPAVGAACRMASFLGLPSVVRRLHHLAWWSDTHTQEECVKILMEAAESGDAP